MWLWSWDYTCKVKCFQSSFKPGFHIAVRYLLRLPAIACDCLRLPALACACSLTSATFHAPGIASNREATVTSGRKWSKFNYLPVVTVVSRYRRQIITNGNAPSATACDCLRLLAAFEMADGRKQSQAIAGNRRQSQVIAGTLQLYGNQAVLQQAFNRDNVAQTMLINHDNITLTVGATQTLLDINPSGHTS